ncbi:MAG: serine/threonine protein kinase [Pseudomonas sp.]|nr:serine/threonine protein kinase [Pseudomonas sp.]
MLRLLSLAALLAGLPLTLSVQAASIDAASYGYPITNAFEATIGGTPPQLRPAVANDEDIDQADYRLNLEAVRAETMPDIFWNGETLPYRLAQQDGPAPLIFIIAGTGAQYSSGKPEFLKKLFYAAGYHVVQLSSPTSYDFITAASRRATPGISSDDAQDLYRVMEAIKAEHSELQVTSYNLTGYSLGALNAAFVSQIDDSKHSFNFKRVLMLNPPVDLLTSVGNLDRLSRVELDLNGKPPSFDMLFERLAHYFKEKGRIEVDEALIFDLQNSKERLSTPAMASLVGSAFRFSVADIVYTSDLINKRGLITPVGMEIDYSTELVPFFKKAAACNFRCYAEQHLLPLWQQHNIGGTLAQLDKQVSLYALENYLKTSPKISVMTNADDLILGPGDLSFLRRTFGERLTIYPLGGHCGNLDYRVNTDAMLEFFRG